MNWFRKLLQPKSASQDEGALTSPAAGVVNPTPEKAAEAVPEKPENSTDEKAAAVAMAESIPSPNGTHTPASVPAVETDNPIIANLETLITEPKSEANSREAPTPAETVVLRLDKDETPATTPRATAPLPSTGELAISLVDSATRPLPQDVVLEFSPLTHVAFAQATDIGRTRTNNQDTAFTFFASSRSVDEIPDFGLFIVADGMGGHQDGEKASAIAARVVASQVLNSMYLPIVSKQNKTNDVPIAESLANAIQKANVEAMSLVPEGGTTLSSVVLIGDRAYIAHVGDSRIYLFHHGVLEKLTRDHSLVQRLIELDQITIEEAADHPQKNVLYRALGQNEIIDVDTLTKRLPQGSMMLLCSDGLWNQVTDREISEVISRIHDPQEACQKLISLANAQGGIDNVTVILLQLPG
ncbi:MAG: protein phosphatase 2C domain-containing protein [Anaerolineae bacterium]|nr:protein phosphatase 2C domain-containing protein [Anaerolineae bacterium]